MSKQWFLAASVWLVLLLPSPLLHAAEAPLHEQFTRVTTNRVVEPQQRRAFEFPASGITFDTQFDGARVKAIEQTGTSSFTVRVEPENSPINDSAWYAFRARSHSTQAVTITFSYPPGEKHRYAPRLSYDGINWRLANTSNSPATLSVSLSPEPLYISGQELVTSEDFEAWISALKTNRFVRHRQIGTSTLGKPLHLLEISEAPGNADMVFVLGRQHPPEVTGTMALQSFVDALCDQNDQVSAFRHKFRLIVVPLINPDGVEAGHWRHNANGVDLNRDWGQFNQPETRRVSSELLDIVMNSTGKVRFGLDFHSTRRDVFYTTHSRNVGDNLAERWLGRLQELAPDYEVRAQPGSDATKGPTYTSASWMRRVFAAPAITYEVGDQTDRELIRTVARKSAAALVQVLSQDPPRQVSRPPAVDEGRTDRIQVALYQGAGVSGAGPGKILAWFKESPTVAVRPVSAAEIQEGKLKDYDVVIFPGGTGSGQSKALGEDGREQVRRRLRDGGGYIGICAGSYLASSGSPSNLRIIDAKTVSPKWQRGTGMVGLRVTLQGSELLQASVPAESSVKYQNGPILMPAGVPEIEDYTSVALFTSEVADNDTPKGIMTGSPAAVAGTYGKGRVVCFSPHPEQTPGLEPLLESAIKWAAHGSAKATLRP